MLDSNHDKLATARISALEPNVCVTLFQTRQAKQTGRPGKVGKRLATLKSLLATPQTTWQVLTIEGWNGGCTCELQLTSDTAVWYHTGLPAVAIGWGTG